MEIERKPRKTRTKQSTNNAKLKSLPGCS